VQVVSQGDQGAIRVSARRARGDDRIDLCAVAESARYDEVRSGGTILILGLGHGCLPQHKRHHASGCGSNPKDQHERQAHLPSSLAACIFHSPFL
jgi:hypothetical protein